MGDPANQTEIEKLRAEIEGYRQHELADLREQLVSARADAVHYRAEAERNANIGRQIYTEGQVETARLRARVQSLEQLPNARPTVQPD